MEELNKNQLVLLTILVSFVVSIATGVLTVSLLAGDPEQSVGQTITRVVERTIERVVPGETRTTIVREPVIITEEELTVQTIASASSSIVTISQPANPGVVLGIGFAVGPNMVVTTAVLPAGVSQYQLNLSGKNLPGNFAKIENGISVLRYVPVDPKFGLTLVPVKLSAQNPSVGQSVVAVGVAEGSGDQAAVGVITGLTSSTTAPSLIKTRAAIDDLVGGPLYNTHSEAVGIVNAAGSAIPAKYIQALVDSLRK